MSDKKPSDNDNGCPVTEDEVTKCDQAPNIAEIKVRQEGFENALSQMASQYVEILQKLDAVTDLLRDTAVNQNDIIHIKNEQVAQWKKMDSIEDRLAKRLEDHDRNLTAKIASHIENCRGPGDALRKAEEAYALASSSAEAARKLSQLPGKWAIMAILGLFAVASNVITAVITAYLIKALT